MIKNKLSILTFFTILFSFSSCMKSRVQLRGETEQNEAPAPVVVTDLAAQEQAKVLDEMRAEINKLNQKIEDLEKNNKDLNNDIAKKSKEKSSDSIQLEERIHELEQAQAAMIEAIKKKEKEVQSPKVSETDAVVLARAESLYQAKQYKKAILEYNTLIEKFPKSKKIPQALLRISKSFDKLGMKSDAKVFAQELKEKYPQSIEAKKGIIKGE